MILGFSANNAPRSVSESKERLWGCGLHHPVAGESGQEQPVALSGCRCPLSVTLLAQSRALAGSHGFLTPMHILSCVDPLTQRGAGPSPCPLFDLMEWHQPSSFFLRKPLLENRRDRLNLYGSQPQESLPRDLTWGWGLLALP